jgi:hypothetical protein
MKTTRSTTPDTTGLTKAEARAVLQTEYLRLLDHGLCTDDAGVRELKDALLALIPIDLQGVYKTYLYLYPDAPWGDPENGPHPSDCDPVPTPIQTWKAAAGMKSCFRQGIIGPHPQELAHMKY